MSPPPDALTAEGYDMTFGTNVIGWLIWAVSRHSRDIDGLDFRTLLLHRIGHPRFIQGFHPRTQVPSRYSLLANGNHGGLSLRFRAGFLNL